MVHFFGVEKPTHQPSPLRGPRPKAPGTDGQNAPHGVRALGPGQEKTAPAQRQGLVNVCERMHLCVLTYAARGGVSGGNKTS